MKTCYGIPYYQSTTIFTNFVRIPNNSKRTHINFHIIDRSLFFPSYGMQNSVQFNFKGPISQTSECTCPISHNRPCRTELFWMLHCSLWDKCNVGFVILVYQLCFIANLTTYNTRKSKIHKKNIFKTKMYISRVYVHIAALYDIEIIIMSLSVKISIPWGILVEALY